MVPPFYCPVASATVRTISAKPSQQPDSWILSTCAPFPGRDQCTWSMAIGRVATTGAPSYKSIRPLSHPTPWYSSNFLRLCAMCCPVLNHPGSIPLAPHKKDLLRRFLLTHKKSHLTTTLWGDTRAPVTWPRIPVGLFCHPVLFVESSLVFDTSQRPIGPRLE